ncbi:MAG: hypothetical protein AAFY20_11325 [Cyanobacteria bacterium J06639_14]
MNSECGMRNAEQVGAGSADRPTIPPNTAIQNPPRPTLEGE